MTNYTQDPVIALVQQFIPGDKPSHHSTVKFVYGSFCQSRRTIDQCMEIVGVEHPSVDVLDNSCDHPMFKFLPKQPTVHVQSSKHAIYSDGETYCWGVDTIKLNTCDQAIIQKMIADYCGEVIRQVTPDRYTP